MDKKPDDVSDVNPDLTPDEAKALADFTREMTEKVIPEIVEVVQERRVLASQSRHWQLKT